MADMFSPKPPADTTSIKWPTPQAFLEATRSGEIPELVLSDKRGDREAVGRSVRAILQTEAKSDLSELRSDAPQTMGFLLMYVTEYELSGQKEERWAKEFSHQIGGLTGGGPKYEPSKLEIHEAFTSFAKDYAVAVREYINSKKQREDEREVAESTRQRKEALAQAQMEEERLKIKEAAEAKVASEQAEQDARLSSVKKAMDEQTEARKQKIKEVESSDAYQLWLASLRIEEGLRMISAGNAGLAKDDAIQRESGVSDLAVRRQAGDQIVAGKQMVEKAFATYRELGGTAPTPEEVKAGPDPAAEYR